jgi:D-threo-aldose 1-dehydrogenase
MSASAEVFTFGGAQIGGLYAAVDEATSTAALSAAWAAGVRRFDTAPHYGAGLSEERLGAFLAQFPRDSYLLSTKVGRLLVDTDDDTEGAFGFYGAGKRHRIWDFSAEGVRRSLAQSLDRLGLDRIDIALIHDPDQMMDQAVGEAFPALAELRAEGAINAVGAGMNTVAPLARFVRETDVDTVMVAGRYTLLDRSAAAELLPACVDQGVSVIAAGVFNSGLLADPRPGATYDYVEAPAALLARARAIQQVCADHGVPLRAAAVQFPLRHPAVTTVAVGTGTAAHLHDTVNSFGFAVPEALWADLDTVSAD